MKSLNLNPCFFEIKFVFGALLLAIDKLPFVTIAILSSQFFHFLDVLSFLPDGLAEVEFPLSDLVHQHLFLLSYFGALG